MASANALDGAVLHTAPGRPGTPISGRLHSAMQRERALQSAQPDAHCDGSLRRAPELISQLALKRGVQRRGSPGTVDLSKQQVKAALLAPKLNTRLMHDHDPGEMLCQLHWFDDLQGCVPRCGIGPNSTTKVSTSVACRRHTSVPALWKIYGTCMIHHLPTARSGTCNICTQAISRI